MTEAYDLIIIGGGVVGLSLALRLGQMSNYRILVVEARDLNKAPILDRSMALSYSSQKFFSEVGIWEKLAPKASAIERVHVSIQGHYGVSRMDASYLGVPSLGQVISLKTLENTLVNSLKNYNNVILLNQAKLLDLKLQNETQAFVEYQGQQHTFKAKLLIGTDGVSSHVAKCANFSYEKTEYGHTAIICHVDLSIPHKGTAYERFTQEGALAFLPYGPKRSTFVWSVPHLKANMLLALNEKDFLVAALKEFGFRLGRFLGCTSRVAFPLIQSIAHSQCRKQVVLMGNSAHNLHPIAAQGLNLSLRDIRAFCDAITPDLDSPQWRVNYLSKVAQDQQKVILMTDQIAKQISSSRFPGLIKAGALIGFDGLTPLKRGFTKFAMGITL